MIQYASKFSTLTKKCVFCVAVTVLSKSIETPSQSAFLQYLSLGGNYIGVHSASDCLTATPWFGNETGVSTTTGYEEYVNA
jgi:hypothetical protein